MKWELGALKMLARNEVVPGVALRDAISEIERLQKEVNRLIKEKQDTLEAMLPPGVTMTRKIDDRGSG